MDTERERIRADQIDAVLPQTQCRRCGYSGCRPYAEALASGRASINGCPPGGETTRVALARLTGQALIPPQPKRVDEQRRVALVVETDCIGCTKCIQACPVDAIIGSAGRMHTVVERWCTGCALCVPVCPTDCIEMRAPLDAGLAPTRDQARARFAAHTARLTAGRGARADAGYVDVSGAARGDLRASVLEAVRRRRATDGAPTADAEPASQPAHE